MYCLLLSENLLAELSLVNIANITGKERLQGWIELASGEGIIFALFITNMLAAVSVK